MPPASKDELGHHYIESCAFYKSMIPSVHFPVNVLFLEEEPRNFEAAMRYLSLVYDRIFVRKLPEKCVELARSAVLTRDQLCSFKWSTRIFDEDDSILEMVFVIAKRFSDSLPGINIAMPFRREVLSEEPWIEKDSLLPGSVRCAGCGHKVSFEEGRRYSLLTWVTHRDKCRGIDAKIMQAVFTEWEDATDDTDLEVHDSLWKRPYQSVIQPFRYPLRYPKLSPTDAEDTFGLRDEDDESDATYSDDGTSSDHSDELSESSFGTLYDGPATEDNLPDVSWTVVEDFDTRLRVLPPASPNSPLDNTAGAPSPVFSEAPLEDQFGTGIEEQEEDFEGLFESPKSGVDDGFILHGATRSSSDGSLASLDFQDDDDDNDSPPRWVSLASYHPGYYDFDDSDIEDGGVSSDEEENVRYISYAEHLETVAATTTSEAQFQSSEALESYHNNDDILRGVLEGFDDDEFSAMFRETMRTFD